MWHALSGLPDNVTDEGIVVRLEPGRHLSFEKESLRAAIAQLRAGPEEVRNLARLAAGYLLAGDTETARRCVARAALILSDADASAGSG